MKIYDFLKFTLFIIIVSNSSINAQSLNSAGTSSKNNTAMVTWSLGELVMSGDSKFPTGILPRIQIEKEVITNIHNELNLQVSIYPNPTSNIIHILNNNNNVSIAHSYEIVDVSGKHYLSERNSNKTVDLDLSEVPPGLYLLLITNENTSQSYKIIKK